MRIKILLGVVACAAILASAPAGAQTVCIQDSPNPTASVCAGVFEYDDGFYRSTFVGAEATVADVTVGAFAGSEELTDGSYRGTGACAYHDGGVPAGDGCVVLFEYDGEQSLWVYSDDADLCLEADLGGPTEC